MQSKLKQALSEHERMRSELAAARLEVGELRSAHGEGCVSHLDPPMLNGSHMVGYDLQLLGGNTELLSATGACCDFGCGDSF